MRSERWDFKRHGNLLRLPRITVLEGRECTGCSQQPPLASCSLLQRNPHLTPQSCWKHRKSIRPGVQTRRGSAQCKHSKGVQHQELDLEDVSRHRYANSRSSNEDMVKKRRKYKHANTLCSRYQPQGNCVGQIQGSITSELPQQEARWGEGGRVCERHNQSNKFTAHHYILKTAFSSAQINDPRLYQVNYLMHN